MLLSIISARQAQPAEAGRQEEPAKRPAAEAEAELSHARLEQPEGRNGNNAGDA